MGTRGEKWRVESIEGKGMGVTATADIKQGELILTDRPLFIVPNSAHTDDPEELNRVLSSKVEELSEADREYFYSLSDCKSVESKTARGIYFTNCFTIGSYVGSPTAMLPRLSRINHSCQPNTEFHWEAAQGAEHLRAIRDIREGEELLDCYLDLTLEGRVTRDERRRTLKGGYDFWCECASCDQPSGDIEGEDRLRLEAFNLS